MRSLLHTLPALLLAALAAAQTPTVRTILSSGPTSNRYDMVILGDGYTAAEQQHFDNDCTAFLTALFQKQPYTTFASYINVHSVFRPSTMSGANHPDLTPPVYNNPVYGSSYNTGGTARCLYVANTGLALADAALAPANEGRVIVLVNDSRYGGCAATFSVSYNGASMTEVQIHEIGHSLGSLADEYDYPNNTYTGSEPSQANITTSPVGQKWSHWWGYNGVSAFQGAGYYLYGLFRPVSNCLMRSLGVPLCPVCREQISRTVNAVVSTIEQPQPAGTQLTLLIGAQQAFSFVNLVPAGNNPVITWHLDGQVLSGQNGTSYTLDTAPLALGPHTLTVTVQDQTPLVRQDPNNALRDTRTWNISVADPLACDLQVTRFSGRSIYGTVGGDVDLDTTVYNDGPAAAATFRVEHFLSTDQTFQTTDIYLGGYTVNGLGAGLVDVNTRRVHVPARLEQRLYFLIAKVDRLDLVHEVNEANNQRLYVLFVQGQPCAPALEFRDDLLYPGDQATLSIQSGGTLLPTVVARCEAPGTAYVIVWGGSGTQPGTPLAPGVTVPINLDFFSDLGLHWVNGAVFQQFFGVLDSGGVGRATIQWPAGLALQGPLPTHFAAVLLDPSLQWSGVTSPVSFTLQ